MSATCSLLSFSVRALLLGYLAASLAEAAPPVPMAYPRLLGVQIGDPNYYDDASYQEQLARFDVLVLNFWPGWKDWKYGAGSIERAVLSIKRRNPSILIGQYTVLNEAKAVENPDRVNVDIAEVLDKQRWWLVNGRGIRQQWTDRHQAYDVNITAWTQPDRAGRRFPEWLADRNYAVTFRGAPSIDFWYLDNTLSQSPVRRADWNGDGADDRADEPDIAAAYRRGHVRYWQRIRSRQPQVLLMGNVDSVASPEYAGGLDGVFLEALIGASWSTETRAGWRPAMDRYREALGQVRRRDFVGFGVTGARDDYRLLRYGLASCLLDDGLFTFTPEPIRYGSVAWFDEFDVELGYPLEPPVTRPLVGTVFARRFSKGLILVNPGARAATVRVPDGYRRFQGRQAPDVNDGQPVSAVVLGARDGLLLVRADPLPAS